MKVRAGFIELLSAGLPCPTRPRAPREECGRPGRLRAHFIALDAIYLHAVPLFVVSNLAACRIDIRYEYRLSDGCQIGCPIAVG